MKRQRPRTYEATFHGQKTRVTIPPRETVAYSGEASEVLWDVLRDNLSPKAMAVLANAIRVQLNGKLADHDVRNRLGWLVAMLLGMVGERYHALCNEAGL